MMQRIFSQISLLAKAKGVRQALLTVGGNTMATGVSAVTMMLISRQLGPTLFGEFSVGFAIILIITRLNDAGLNSALQKFAGGAKTQAKQILYFSLSLKYRFMLSIVLLLLSFVGYLPLSTLLHISHPTIVLIALTLGIVTAYYEQLSTMLLALHAFGKAVAVNGVQALSKFIGVMVFFAFHQTSVVLIFTWYTLSPVVPLLFWTKFLPKWVKLNWKTKSPQEEREFVTMAGHSAVSFISSGVIENIGVLFVQGYLSSYETGLLGGVSKIAMLFFLISASLSNVLFPRVAKYKRLADLRAYFKKALFAGVCIAAGYIALLPLASLSIRLTIGDAYLAGLPILYLLLGAVFLTIATVPFMALFYSFEANWYFSVSGMIQVLLTIGGNVLFLPQYGLVATAWTTLLTKAVLFLFTFVMGWIFLHRYQEIEVKE